MTADNPFKWNDSYRVIQDPEDPRSYEVWLVRDGRPIAQAEAGPVFNKGVAEAFCAAMNEWERAYDDNEDGGAG